MKGLLFKSIAWLIYRCQPISISIVSSYSSRLTQICFFHLISPFIRKKWMVSIIYRYYFAMICNSDIYFAIFNLFNNFKWVVRDSNLELVGWSRKFILQSNKTIKNPSLSRACIFRCTRLSLCIHLNPSYFSRRGVLKINS